MLADGRNSLAWLVMLGVLFRPISLLGAEPVGQKAVVSGTPTANLRAGAGVEHGLKLVLKEGDAVTIEKAEGEWLLVAAADGQKGYIHRNLLKVAENVIAQPSAAPAPPQKSAEPSPSLTTKGGAMAEPVAAPPAKPAIVPSAPEPIASSEATRVKPEGQSPSLLQILEAHEAEVKIGLLVAGVAFVLGWFCGGFYYVRRENKHRRRLRL